MNYTRDIKTAPPGVFKVFNVGIGVNSFFRIAEEDEVKLNEKNLAFMMSEYGMESYKWPKRSFKGYDATFILFIKTIFPDWRTGGKIRSAYIPKKTEGLLLVDDQIRPHVGRGEIIGIHVTFDTKTGHPFYLDDKKKFFSFT